MHSHTFNKNTNCSGQFVYIVLMTATTIVNVLLLNDLENDKSSLPEEI